MKISVIVPVYNTEKYLDECLQSIQNQTFSDWECLLVDDGSKDNSPAICDAWCAKDPRFKVMHKPNEGASATRGKGLAMAQGEYIIFADNDDFLMPEMLETLYGAVQKENADSAICSFYRLVEGKKPYAFDEKLPVGVLDKKQVYERIALPLISGLAKDDSFVPTIWRMLFCRSILMENHITFVPEKRGFPDDLMFAFEFFLCARSAVVMDTPLYVYRWNLTSSVSCSYNPYRWEVIKTCYDKVLQKCEQYALPREDYYDRASSQFMASMSVAVKQEVQYIGTNGYKTARKNICDIIYDERVAALLGEKFVKEMAFQMRLFAFFEKTHTVDLLILAIKVYLALGMEK